MRNPTAAAAAQGPHLHTVYPHGSTDTLPFVTMGSGSLAAMSVFEADYAEGLDEEAAKQLVARAIKAGIFNDLGSGSNVDLCVITKDGTQYLRNWEKPNERTYRRQQGYPFPPGSTPLYHFKTPNATITSLPLNQARARQPAAMRRGGLSVCCELSAARRRWQVVDIVAGAPDAPVAMEVEASA